MMQDEIAASSSTLSEMSQKLRSLQNVTGEDATSKGQLIGEGREFAVVESLKVYRVRR